MTCAGTGPLQINRPAASSPAPEPHRTIKDLETGSQHLDGCLASAHGAIQVIWSKHNVRLSATRSVAVSDYSPTSVHTTIVR